ncbi:MAG: GGDEF domain-containing protein [Ruminococcus sp.]|nr:GGDEF domain-containing protein [Ruminococcus sp.]
MENKKSGGSATYIVAAIVLAVVTLTSMFLMYYSFTLTNKVTEESNEATRDINTMNEELMSINRNVLMIISGTGNPDNLMIDISNSFNHIYELDTAYKELENNSELTLRRYDQAKIFIDAYYNKIADYQGTLANIEKNQASMKNVYTQEIHPLQITASEMFAAASEIGAKYSAQRTADMYRIFYIVEAIMGGILIIGEIAIIIIARIAKRNRREMERRAEEIAEADKKLRKSREKMSDIAMTNILTGLKNRYALNDDISDLLEDDQFNISVFDMDNFRSINDMYGYDFGDEYLALVSEKLKEEFAEYAEIYNITGNEFCFVFNREVSDSQAVRISERILETLRTPYTVFNINVQLTASGATYHYLPGDCVNVASVLVRLDNVIRDVKRNGGNNMYPVSGI